MPRIHSYLSSKCCVGTSLRGGQGVFAVMEIAKLELIAVWGGKIYTEAEVLALRGDDPILESHAVGVHDGFVLGNLAPGDELDDTELMNHSCDPNAGVKGQIVLLARRTIAAGEEVCFDYETTQTDFPAFPCSCGAPHCRRVIDGRAWRLPAFQDAHRGWLSWHIEERILREVATKHSNCAVNLRLHEPAFAQSNR